MPTAVTSAQVPPRPARRDCITLITYAAFSRIASGDVSSGRTTLSRDAGPGRSSPEPAATNVGPAVSPATVWEKAYREGSGGAPTTGATFVRATGLRPSTSR